MEVRDTATATGLRDTAIPLRARTKLHGILPGGASTLPVRCGIVADVAVILPWRAEAAVDGELEGTRGEDGFVPIRHEETDGEERVVPLGQSCCVASSTAKTLNRLPLTPSTLTGQSANVA